MKKLAKVLSLALVLVMVLSLGGTAWADPTPHSITIDIPAADKDTHTYTLYQLFTGDVANKEPDDQTFTDGLIGVNGYHDTELSNIHWGSAFIDPSDPDNTSKIEAFINALLDESPSEYVNTNIRAINEILSLYDTAGSKYTTDAATVADALSHINDKAAAEELAKILAWLARSRYLNLKENKEVDASSADKVVFDGQDSGYYFITDELQNNGVPGAASKYILQVLGDVELKAKTEVPSSFKKVDDKDDSNRSEDTTTWQDSADYDVGDHVPYKLTAFIPTYVFDTFTSYNLSFVDDLSAGLTLDADSVKISAYQISGSIPDNGISSFDNRINGTDAFYTSVQSGSTVYWKPLVPIVSDTTNSKYSGGTVFTFDLGNIMDSEHSEFYINKTNFYHDVTDHTKDASYVVVEIEYTAELNTNAVLNEKGNPNTSHIVYSRNPNNVNDMGSTPDDTVIVFTYQAVINKEDENHNPLTGADFRFAKLYANYTATDDDVNKYVSYTDTSVTPNVIYFLPKVTGTNVYVTNTLGSIIEVPAAEAGKNGNSAALTTPAVTATAYQNVYVPLTLTKSARAYTPDGGSETTVQNSVFTSPKIDAGTYLVTETVTPAGYNAIGPKALVITATHEILANDPHLTTLAAEGWTLGSTKTDEKITDTDGTFKTNVVNKSGTVLPTTGGVGTTLFYVFGSMLVIAAAVYFVTKKRSEVE